MIFFYEFFIILFIISVVFIGLYRLLLLYHASFNLYQVLICVIFNHCKINNFISFISFHCFLFFLFVCLFFSLFLSVCLFFLFLLSISVPLNKLNKNQLIIRWSLQVSLAIHYNILYKILILSNI